MSRYIKMTNNPKDFHISLIFDIFDSDILIDDILRIIFKNLFLFDPFKIHFFSNI